MMPFVIDWSYNNVFKYIHVHNSLNKKKNLGKITNYTRMRSKTFHSQSLKYIVKLQAGDFSLINIHVLQEGDGGVKNMADFTKCPLRNLRTNHVTQTSLHHQLT